MLFTVLAYVLVVPVIWLAWAAAHEFAHGRMAKYFKPEAQISYKLYPHVDDELGFQWAYSRWVYKGSYTESQRGWIYFAPRLVDSVGVIGAPLATMLPSPWDTPVTLLLAGGIVDMAYGSIGYKVTSDLRRWTESWNFSLSWARFLGWVVATLSAAITSLLFWG